MKELTRIEKLQLLKNIEVCREKDLADTFTCLYLEDNIERGIIESLKEEFCEIKYWVNHYVFIHRNVLPVHRWNGPIEEDDRQDIINAREEWLSFIESKCIS